ncbi:MAG: hypothetical protein ABSG17_24315 [Spirochaetia bacterium]|jgi:hypothetical protein
MKVIDRIWFRLALKGLSSAAIAVGALFAALVWVVPVAVCFVVAFSSEVLGYLLSGRLSAPVLYRIRGVLEAAYHTCSFTESEDVRITAYVPCMAWHNFVKQVVPYYPATSRRSSFRHKMPTSKGIVGLCYRKPKACGEIIGPADNFKDKMVKKWGFTPDEADKLKVRGSYYAFPITDAENKVRGVVYVDSARVDAFRPERVDRMVKACVPLARWLKTND